MQKPLNTHFQQLKRLLRYLKGTSKYYIHLTTGSLQLYVYSDSNWAGDNNDRKSTSGFCAFLGKNLISWSTKKQPTVARSSTEAEYRALASAASDITWLRQLLKDFGLHQTSPTPLYCDNVSAMDLANNPIFHARTKHIEVDYHYILDCIQKKEIEIHYTSTVDQLADLFTKILPSTVAFHHIQILKRQVNEFSELINLKGLLHNQL